MTNKAIRELHGMTCRYARWLALFVEEERIWWEVYEDSFDKRVEKFR